MQNIHLDIHITRSSDRAGQAANILKQAMNLLEQHRGAVSSDNYNMARGWLTRAQDYRSGLEDKNVVGRYQQSHAYLEEAHETLRKIQELISGIYSTPTS